MRIDRGRDSILALALSLLMVGSGVVLSLVIALLQSGAAACGLEVGCDFEALAWIGLLTPASVVCGILYVLTTIGLRSRCRPIWWVPLPAVGGVLAAFAVSAALTRSALP